MCRWYLAYIYISQFSFFKEETIKQLQKRNILSVGKTFEIQKSDLLKHKCSFYPENMFKNVNSTDKDNSNIFT